MGLDALPRAIHASRETAKAHKVEVRLLTVAPNTCTGGPEIGSRRLRILGIADVGYVGLELRRK